VKKRNEINHWIVVWIALLEGMRFLFMQTFGLYQVVNVFHG
jgi:hypothetical protein